MNRLMRLFIAADLICLAALLASGQYVSAVAVTVFVLFLILSWRRDERMFREIEITKKELDAELDKMRRYNKELENELAAIRKY